MEKWGEVFRWKEGKFLMKLKLEMIEIKGEVEEGIWEQVKAIMEGYADEVEVG